LLPIDNFCLPGQRQRRAGTAEISALAEKEFAHECDLMQKPVGARRPVAGGGRRRHGYAGSRTGGQPAREGRQAEPDGMIYEGIFGKANTIPDFNTRRHVMYAITGITGKVGGALAKVLIEAGEPVRAVLRDPAKADIWRERDCEIAFADMGDATLLAAAFKGAKGVFILPPSEFDPAPGYPEAARQNEVLTIALLAARPERVVCLSPSAPMRNRTIS
jgi:hypothetical protein